MYRKGTRLAGIIVWSISSWDVTMLSSADENIHVACEGSVKADRDLHVAQKGETLTVQQDDDTDGCREGSVGKGESRLSIESVSGTIIVK